MKTIPTLNLRTCNVYRRSDVEVLARLWLSSILILTYIGYVNIYHCDIYNVENNYYNSITCNWMYLMNLSFTYLLQLVANRYDKRHFIRQITTGFLAFNIVSSVRRDW